MNPSGRVVGAVQAAAPATPNLYFETQSVAGPSLTISGSPPAKACAAGHGAAISGVERQSPRSEWRQRYRLASGTIQLNTDSFQGKGARVNRVRPSTAPRERTVQAHQQLFEYSLEPKEDAAVALLKGRSLIGSSQAAKRRADAVTAVVPAPPVL